LATPEFGVPARTKLACRTLFLNYQNPMVLRAKQGQTLAYLNFNAAFPKPNLDFPPDGRKKKQELGGGHGKSDRQPWG
jgi:hypothetical protein